MSTTPWVIDLHHTRDQGGRTYAYVYAGGAVPIAAVVLGAEGMPQDDGRSVARLIAAAPDLVAALEAAQEELRLIRLKDCDRVYQPGLGAQIALALAKAKGEQT